MNNTKNSELTERLLAEKKFHDNKYSQEKNKNFYAIGFKSIIFNALLDKVGDLHNKKMVDFGCGNGWQTKIFAGKGAQVCAFDISSEAVKQTKQFISSLGLQDRVYVNQMPAEKLAYKDNTFDMVIGNAILHHLDLKIATNEIHRILKKGGKAFFLEPLGHNPFINLYRKFTPDIRTDDEVPLRFEHFDILRKRFSRVDHEEYYFLVLFSFFWYFIIRNDKLLLRTRTFLYKLETILFKIFPYLKRHCWYTIIEMEK